MPLRLDARDPGFADAFRRLVDLRREEDSSVSADVARIIADVRRRGLDAVRELTARFDHVDIDAVGMEITPAEIDTAAEQVPPETRDALEVAAQRIRIFHERQRPADHDGTDEAGVRAGWRWSAVDRAGLYVPGGRAAYPSSVLMNAIPAVVAGVDELIMVTPTPGGEINPLVLLAAKLAGVGRVFRIGGAQAIAALAYGVDPVPRCDVVVGPGNAWVAEAKRQLYGQVGIDMVAGPSEILVIADASAHPTHVAADLLSQAEHDPVAQSILITDSSTLADAVEAEVERLLPGLTTQQAARESWERFGTVITVPDIADSVSLANELAAEHLELMVAEPDTLFRHIRHAGSVFLGHHTPESIGDYLGGPNHVLPTGRRARFASGLGVLNFMKRTTFLDATAAFDRLAAPTATLADAEGLPAHALAVRVRVQRRS